MQEKATVEEFKQLPSVGETTAKVLQDAGYKNFEDLVRANPMTIHDKCDIVISSATHIISAAVDHIDGQCPMCERSEIKNSWEEYSGAIPEDSNAEIVCKGCGWYGLIDELK
jgi:RecG-like helicase